MKIILTYIGFLLFMWPLTSLSAQEQEEIEMVPFSRDFKFKDGLYLNIDAVRFNNPIPLGRIVTDLENYNRDFFNDMIIMEEIVLYDESGVRASIRTRDIWGYALNGRLYIMLGGKFQRIILEGSISHFIASATTREGIPYAKDKEKSYTTTQDLHRLRVPGYYSYVSAEGKVSLFDFESNTLTGYNPESLGKLLERDSVLFTEYASLRTRKKKQRMVEFIHRYNQKHPLYFPLN